MKVARGEAQRNPWNRPPRHQPPRRGGLNNAPHLPNIIQATRTMNDEQNSIRKTQYLRFEAVLPPPPYLNRFPLQ